MLLACSVDTPIHINRSHLLASRCASRPASCVDCACTSKCNTDFILHHRNLEEATAAHEEETRIRAKLQGEVRNLNSDLDHLREQLEEEQEARAELQRALTKANNDVVAWKQKCESGEGGVR